MHTVPCTICGDPVVELVSEEDEGGRCCVDCALLNLPQGYGPRPAPRAGAVPCAALPPVQCRPRPAA
jgi:hypothetical protein